MVGYVPPIRATLISRYSSDFNKETGRVKMEPERVERLLTLWVKTQASLSSECMRTILCAVSDYLSDDEHSVTTQSAL